MTIPRQANAAERWERQREQALLARWHRFAVHRHYWRKSWRRRDYTSRPPRLCLHVRLKELWDKAVVWARGHGKEYVPTYGIVGVAPL